MKSIERDIRKLTTVIVVCVVLMLASCVTNDGDIGSLYGQWALTEMTVDSEKADIDVKLYFWKFQSNIIQIQKDMGFDYTCYSIGTWERLDDELLLNFTHSEGPEGSGEWPKFNPPPELGIPGRVISPLEIETLNNRDMVLRYVNTDGQEYHYTFRKLL